MCQLALSLCPEMRPMKDKFFVDSNIFLYALSDLDSSKQTIASDLIVQEIMISTQVVNEVSNNMIKKLKFNNTEVRDFIESCYVHYSIINFNQQIFTLACDLREKYALSYYDSLIVASALVSQATILYSEDMQHNLLVNEKMTIINPFVQI